MNGAFAHLCDERRRLTRNRPAYVPHPRCSVEGPRRALAGHRPRRLRHSRRLGESGERFPCRHRVPDACRPIAAPGEHPPAISVEHRANAENPEFVHLPRDILLCPSWRPRPGPSCPRPRRALVGHRGRRLRHSRRRGCVRPAIPRARLRVPDPGRPIESPGEHPSAIGGEGRAPKREGPRFGAAGARSPGPMRPARLARSLALHRPRRVLAGHRPRRLRVQPSQDMSGARFQRPTSRPRLARSHPSSPRRALVGRLARKNCASHATLVYLVRDLGPDLASRYLGLRRGPKTALVHHRRRRLRGREPRIRASAARFLARLGVPDAGRPIDAPGEHSLAIGREDGAPHAAWVCLVRDYRSPVPIQTRAVPLPGSKTALVHHRRQRLRQRRRETRSGAAAGLFLRARLGVPDSYRPIEAPGKHSLAVRRELCLKHVALCQPRHSDSTSHSRREPSRREPRKAPAGHRRRTVRQQRRLGVSGARFRRLLSHPRP